MIEHGFTTDEVIFEIRWRGFVGFRDTEERERSRKLVKNVSIFETINKRENILSEEASEAWGKRLSGQAVDIAAYVRNLRQTQKQALQNYGIKHMPPPWEAFFRRQDELISKIECARKERKASFRANRPIAQYKEQIAKYESELLSLKPPKG